jgi:hypothetical protein
MGLRSQPEFEQMGGTFQEEASHDEEKVKYSPTAQAKKEVSTTVGRSFEPAFKDKCGVFDTATVEGLAMSAPRIKGEQGALFLGQEDLGDVIEFELVSFNHRWALGSGENDKEARDYFRVSYDNTTISGDGMLISDYMDDLKSKGFKRAKKSPYLDLWGFVVWSKNKGAIPVDERQLVCLQCSQTSMGAFTGFATTRGLLESKGVAKPIDVIGVHAEKKMNSKQDKYTNFSFFVPKAK